MLGVSTINELDEADDDKPIHHGERFHVESGAEPWGRLSDKAEAAAIEDGAEHRAHHQYR